MNMSDQQQRIREGERMYGTVFNSSSDAVITALGRSAVEIAANAAADYLRNKKVTGRSGIDTQKLLDIIRAQVKSHLDEALNDAKDALDANMSQVATATFKASMIQAGLAAAKEYEKTAPAENGVENSSVCHACEMAISGDMDRLGDSKVFTKNHQVHAIKSQTSDGRGNHTYYGACGAELSMYEAQNASGKCVCGEPKRDQGSKDYHTPNSDRCKQIQAGVENAVSFKCKGCDQTFDSESAAIKHRESGKRTPGKPDGDHDVVVQNSTFGCNGCDDSRAPLDKHGYCEACHKEQGAHGPFKAVENSGDDIGKDRNAKGQCAYCHKRAIKDDNHLAPDGYVCDACAGHLNAENGFTTSDKMVMKEGVTCPKCGDSGRLYVSTKTGHCDSCMQEEYNKSGHVKNAENDAALLCTHCGKKTEKRGDKFYCAKCDRSYTESYLKGDG